MNPVSVAPFDEAGAHRDVVSKLACIIFHRQKMRVSDESGLFERHDRSISPTRFSFWRVINRIVQLKDHIALYILQ
jgi:hypothetical protein